MFKYLEIVWNSFKMALSEFRSNKLRTFLSLFGITVGIFCIIGVLATVDSLQRNVQNDIKSLGSNTIYIDKWDYTGQIPWWKLLNRPVPKYEEVKMLKQRSGLSQNVAFNISSSTKIEWDDEAVTNVNIYGITEDFSHIQKLDIEQGRFFQQSDFENSTNTAIIGYNIAEKLFVKPEKAVGQDIMLYGRKAVVIGLLKKKGQSMMGGYDYDEALLLDYGFMRGLINEKTSQPVIVLQGKENVPMKMLRDDVQGAMRSIRKIRPTQADDFSMNDIEAFGEFMAGIFSGVNMGGWFIASLSLIVGMFGVANIMFVTVRERTGQIGLKKAIGAKRSSIMTEFLLESAFLCILGGAIGLLLVYILTKLISPAIGFPVTISLNILTLAISICVITGVLAGIIPAFIAARMDPVVAIRSK
ncbi:MAG: ABC transporter permease [Chitinophagaceae bacterium]